MKTPEGISGQIYERFLGKRITGEVPEGILEKKFLVIE